MRQIVHCCLLWSSKYTENCISLYQEIKSARGLSLAFRVKSMAYLESIQLNFQPSQHGMASVIPLVEAQVKDIWGAVNN